MNPFEVGQMEPHKPRQRATHTPLRLVTLLMVIVAGLILGILVLFAFLALFVWAMFAESMP